MNQLNLECENDDESVEYIYEDEEETTATAAKVDKEEEHKDTVGDEKAPPEDETGNSWYFVEEPSAPARGGVVICPRCTLENDPLAQHCAACELSLIATGTTTSSDSLGKTNKTTTTAPIDDVPREEDLETARLTKKQRQEAIDHELAVQYAAQMEEDMDTDLQSFLGNGTAQPTQSNKEMKLIFRWAEIIETEMETMKASLHEQEVSKVVRIIPREMLIQRLESFHAKWRKFFRRPRLGFFLTSQTVEDVLRQGVAGTTKSRRNGKEDIQKENLGLLFQSSNRSIASVQANVLRTTIQDTDAGGALPPLDPSWQLGVRNTRSSGSVVPDFCWLVLYLEVPHKSGAYIRYLRRDREQDLFAEIPGQVSWDVIHSHDNGVAIPLVCTANANFRRLYRNTTKGADTNARGNSHERVYSKRYWNIYQQLRDVVFAELENSKQKAKTT